MRLVAQLGDLQAHLDLLPLALVHYGLLQCRSQTGTDDVADLPGLEQGHYDFVVKTTVRSKQAHLGGTQILQGGLNKSLKKADGIGGQGFAIVLPVFKTQCASVKLFDMNGAQLTGAIKAVLEIVIQS